MDRERSIVLAPVVVKKSVRTYREPQPQVQRSSFGAKNVDDFHGILRQLVEHHLDDLVFFFGRKRTSKRARVG